MSDSNLEQRIRSLADTLNMLGTPEISKDRGDKIVQAAESVAAELAKIGGAHVAALIESMRGQFHDPFWPTYLAGIARQNTGEMQEQG